MLIIIIGVIIGLVLGLTGAGGSIFAVPLLIIFLDLPVQEAMGISLGVVAACSLFGMSQRLKSNLILFTPGLILAFTGALFAPLGRWLSLFTNPNILILGFTLLSIIIAVKMWRQASKHPAEATIVRVESEWLGTPATSN